MPELTAARRGSGARTATPTGHWRCLLCATSHPAADPVAAWVDHWTRHHTTEDS